MNRNHSCPRRMKDVGPWDRREGIDRWSNRHGIVGSRERACTFCGSLPPDRFLELVEQGYVVGPTDKTYKAYLHAPGDGPEGGSMVGKFYFQHFTADQQQQFVDLLNAKRVAIGYPGHFYVPPFFVSTP